MTLVLDDATTSIWPRFHRNNPPSRAPDELVRRRLRELNARADSRSETRQEGKKGAPFMCVDKTTGQNATAVYAIMNARLGLRRRPRVATRTREEYRSLRLPAN